mmetsp:Transcript_14962/g.42530  ORF Transcript_14962/g.42530 Transcript_14962/m.42530 type:complete len:241 (-) Transcript_14962:125-847(-)
MGASHAEEQHPRVPAWEVEDQEAEDDVQQQVCVATHLHLGHTQPRLRKAALELRVGANNQATKPQGRQDRRERLDQERNQVGRWEGISIGVLSQRSLHAVCLELGCELRDILQRHPEVRAEAEAFHNFLRCEVSGDKVERHVEHTRDRVKHHVACLAVVLKPEADPIRDLRADLVHDRVSHDHDHGEGEPDNESWLAPVLVVECHHIVSIRGIEDNSPEQARQANDAETSDEFHRLLRRG